MLYYPVSYGVARTIRDNQMLLVKSIRFVCVYFCRLRAVSCTLILSGQTLNSSRNIKKTTQIETTKKNIFLEEIL
jgi:hypothetical protein